MPSKSAIWYVNRFRQRLVRAWYFRILMFILPNGLISYYVNIFSASKKSFIPFSIDQFADLYKTDGFVGMWISLLVMAFLVAWLPIGEDPLEAAVIDSGAERIAELTRGAKSVDEVMKNLKKVRDGGRQ